MRLFLLTLLPEYPDLLGKFILDCRLLLDSLHEFLDGVLVMPHHLLVILLQHGQFHLHHRGSLFIASALRRVMLLLPRHLLGQFGQMRGEFILIPRHPSPAEMYYSIYLHVFWRIAKEYDKIKT